MTSKFKVSIIGSGRLGGALAIALAESDVEVESIVVRNIESAREVANLIKSKPRILTPADFAEITSDVVLIATQDSEIVAVADELAKKIRHQPQVFHTSGALSSEILQSLKNINCPVGSIHPLISISDAIRGASKFAGAYFCVEGDEIAVETAEQIVARLGGKSFFIETKYKSLYHASAVTACGHLVALVDAAIEMLTKCGLDEKNAQKILLPLIKSTVENLETQTISSALTGTFARADVETLEKHLASLRQNVSSEAFEIYLQLGARSLHLAEMQGANMENLEKMRERLSLAKNNFK